MKISLLFAALCLTAQAINAQQLPTASSETPWSLNDCIEFAQKNNVGVQQRAIQIEQSNVELSTARFSRVPDLSASTGYNVSFGRSTSDDNTFKTQTLQSGSLNLSAGLPIFEGMRINKQIKGSKLDLEAAVQDLERVREDLSINIMTLYLNVLYNKELLGVAERQLELSTQQVERSRELVAAGKEPESVLFESEALRANNQMTLTQTRNDLTMALLNLSQALNRESAAGFDITSPTLDSLSLAALHRLGSPTAVYDYAAAYRPHIRAERLRLESRQNAIGTARAALYPSISLRGGFGTGVYSSMDASFWPQFRQNSSEFIGVSMSIPIFNRMASRNNIRSAKLAARNQELAVTEAEQSLRKEIEQAWYSADAAYEQYRTSEVAFASAEVAFKYIEEKAAAGRTTIFDFNDAKTRMEKAEADLLQAKYKFIFLSKILDFYKGVPLQL